MKKLNIAIVGSGISGLSAAWALAKAHNVTIFEGDKRFGGHAHTEVIAGTAIDVGFIVFNQKTYPNLTAFLKHLDVPTTATEMGFSVSLDQGKIEYSGGSLTQLIGSPRNAISKQHWSMLADLTRFYRSAKNLAQNLSDDTSLEDFLKQHRFGDIFLRRHLMPMAAAIWSSHPDQMLAYPAKAFIEFFDNHQLLNLGAREKWHTVSGGSATYVKKILASGLHLHSGDEVKNVSRSSGKVKLTCASGHSQTFDHVVLACHADQVLMILASPTPEEAKLLSPFKYSNNQVVLHQDKSVMPRRENHWASWNYTGLSGSANASVTYWMNALQSLKTAQQYFVTLNPSQLPAPEKTHLSLACTHPIFSTQTRCSQKHLWSLQGEQNTWFAGAYFGAGFHEDGLQAGLAVAEQLGGVTRPWTVANPSGRIFVPQLPMPLAVQ